MQHICAACKQPADIFSELKRLRSPGRVTAVYSAAVFATGPGFELECRTPRGCSRATSHSCRVGPEVAQNLPTSSYHESSVPWQPPPSSIFGNNDALPVTKARKTARPLQTNSLTAKNEKYYCVPFPPIQL
ncbi:hypothetical protein J6590_067527 [Homalodisca vitripennis]|nr:hypothetical protein J6590_067527 [Homalodisca vitripennis]